jgi:sugar/nucleoside kinase (ribokinase family)
VPSPPDFDIIGFGAINVDYIVIGPTHVDYFDDLEKGEEHHEEDFRVLERSIENLGLAERQLSVQLGGSTVNTLRALAELAPDLRLGCVSIAGGSPDVLPAGAEPDALPESIERMIEWEGGPPGVCVSVLEGTERTLMTYNNPIATDALGQKRRREAIAEQLARSRLVHVTSFFGDNAPSDVAALMKAVRDRRPDILFSVDVGHVWAGKRATHKVLRHADIVFLNEAELCLLTTFPKAGLSSDREWERALEVLDQLSPRASRLVVLKKKDDAGRGSDYIGRAGAAMYHRTGADPVRYEVMREALPPEKVVDSTGAGDAFAAGVLAGLQSPGVEAARILRLGFSAARYKMQRPGLKGYRGIGRVVLGRSLPPGRGQVFISHSRQDEHLVRALETLLHSGSPLPREQQFFCSSLALQGPRPSRPVRRDIWRSLRAAEYAIFVITPAFLESRECTYELGAADALGIPPIPLLAPELEFRNDLIPVSEKLGGQLHERRDLAAVHGELSDTFGYERVDHRLFEEMLNAVVGRAEQLRPAQPRRPTPDPFKPPGRKRTPARKAAAPAPTRER